MKTLSVLLVVTLLLSFSFTNAAERGIEKRQKQAFDRVKHYFLGAKSIAISPKNGRVEQISGTLSRTLDLADNKAVENYMREKSPAFGVDSGQNTFKVYRMIEDEQNMKHSRVQQYYKGVPVYSGELILHSKNSGVTSFINGHVVNNLDLDVSPGLTPKQALQIALSDVNADLYRWEIPEQEALIKNVHRDPSQTWKPNPKLVVAPIEFNFEGNDYRLAYEMMVPVELPIPANWRYLIDAVSGEIIAKLDELQIGDAEGQGESMDYGWLTIYTDFVGSEYQMHDVNRNVTTYYSEYTYILPGTLFMDDDNIWQGSDRVRSGVQGHWGTEQTWEMMKQTFNYDSPDGSHMEMVSTVDIGAGSYMPNNAYWNGAQTLFGRGDGNLFDALVAVDIVAHEWGHAVTDYHSNLKYSKESGALSEAFSDMMGAYVEHFSRGANANWWIGEDSYTPTIPNDALRYMDDPNQSGQPDTYEGDYWYYGRDDNGGVHTNNGVGNFQFYLLSAGGLGVNDHGYNYNVQGIGINDAFAIWWRANTLYFNKATNYTKAKSLTITAAADLFGENSNQKAQCENAWLAVGVD